MWNLIIYGSRLGISVSEQERVFNMFPHAKKFMKLHNLMGRDAGDFEDSLEMIARIDSFAKIHGVDTLTPVIIGETLGNANYPFYGPIPSQVGYLSNTPLLLNSFSADNYQEFDSFAKYAGRWVATPDKNTDEESDYLNEMLSLSVKQRDENHWNGFVIKQQGHGKLPITIVRGSQTVREALMELYEYHSMMTKPQGFIFQELVSMEDEYRFFVSDGKIVTGAGCIESFTPIDNVNREDFHTIVEGVRGSHNFREDTLLVQEMREFAQKATDSFIRDGVGKFFVIDIAVMVHADGSRNLGVVELNGLTNSGLYASNHDRVVEGVVENPDVFMGISF